MWPYTRGGLAVSYVSGTMLLCIFIGILFKNIESHNTGLIWMSIAYIIFGVFSIAQTFIRAKKREENLEFIRTYEIALNQKKSILKNYKGAYKNWIYIGILYPIAMAFWVYAMMFCKKDSVQMYLGYGLAVVCVATYHVLRTKYAKRNRISINH